MPERQVVLHRPRHGRLIGRAIGRLRWVVALAGLAGVAAVTMPAAPAAADSFPLRQLTGTVTRLAALPNPGRASGVVTLVATETAADGTHPAGWMQFEANGTDIGNPVSLAPGGVATTRAAVSAGASAALSAAFTPTSTAYVASAATDAATVNGTATEAGAITISLTVPEAGYFGVTVTSGEVTLTVPGTATRPFATGMLQPVTVTEYRNYQPGWSVTGQASDLTAAGKPVSATQLGWIPAGTVTGGAKLGVPVASGNPGLGHAGAVLAAATPGSGVGVDTLTAVLLLQVPASARGGPFAGILTLTFVETGPSSAPLEGPSQLPSAR